MHGVDEDGVDQLDDGRFINLRRQHTRILCLFLGLQDLDLILLRRGDVLQQRLHVQFIRLVVLLDRRAHREFTGQHRHDIVARDELEIVDHRHGGGIGDRDRELSSVALERQHGMLGRQLRGDQLEEAGIHLESRQVDCRHTKLPGEHAHDVGLAHHAHLDDGQPDSLARSGRLFLERRFQLLA